jgi:uracil-DNA glycosylase
MDQLLSELEREARRAHFPVDHEVYERCGKDPARPVLFAGSLAAPICVFGRDLGKDEVAAGEPLIGAGGRLVRAGVYEAWHGAAALKSDRRIEAALEHVLLTNTVPYKPPGNKAYAPAVKERFRPYVEQLLSQHWQGHTVITLGNEAFHWFARYADEAEVESLWGREDRYELDLVCHLPGDSPGVPGKRLTVCPLPHPSPLNARWFKRFPELLARRLAKARLCAP